MSRNSKGSTTLTSQSTDFFVTENRYLTRKNAEVTHKLEEMKIKCRELEFDRTHLQKENMDLIFQVRLLKSKLNKINDKMKRLVLPGFASITDFLSDVILESQMPSSPIKLSNTSRRCPDSSMVNRVQQAVKPMVSGHVIENPVIVMKRVKELDRIALRRQQNAEENEIDTSNFERSRRMSAVDEEQEEESEAEEEVSETPNSTTAPHLSTITEEPASNAERYPNEMELHTSSSNAALISGIFSAVNVYVTPLQSLPSLSPRIAKQLSTGRKRTSVFIQSPLNEDEPSTSSAAAAASLSPQITKRKRRNAPVIRDSPEDSPDPTAEDHDGEEVEEMEGGAGPRPSRLSRFPNFLNIDPQPSFQNSEGKEEEKKIEMLQMYGLSPKMKFATSTPNLARTSTFVSMRGKSLVGSNRFKGSNRNSDSTASTSTIIQEQTSTSTITQEQTLTDDTPNSTTRQSLPTINIKSPPVNVKTSRGKSSKTKRTNENTQMQLNTSQTSGEDQTGTAPGATPSPRKPGRPSKSSKMPSCKVMVKRLSLPKRKSRSPDRSDTTPKKQSKRSSAKKTPVTAASPKRPVGRPPRSAKPSGSLKEKPLNKKQRREN